MKPWRPSFRVPLKSSLALLSFAFSWTLFAFDHVTTTTPSSTVPPTAGEKPSGEGPQPTTLEQVKTNLSNKKPSDAIQALKKLNEIKDSLRSEEHTSELQSH